MGDVPQRQFLGWSRAALESARDVLLSRAQGDELDLSRVLLVTSGARAGRLLGALLAEGAQRRGLALDPARTVTPGQLLSALRPDGVPRAGSVQSRVAWAEALRTTPADDLLPLTPTHTPTPGGSRPRADDWPAWLALGDQLARAHADLCAGMVLFEEVPALVDGAVRAGLAPTLAAFDERERWLAAGLAQRAYERVLRGLGLRDCALEDLRAARNAIAGDFDEAWGGAEGGVVDEVVLIATPELPRVAREALTALARAGRARVTALVAAPEALAARFDELGCVVPGAWDTGEALPSCADGSPVLVRFGDTPAEQGALALEAVAALGGAYAPEEIVLGAPDAGVLPALTRAFEEAGARVRAGAGRPLPGTPPARLLARAAAYLRERDFAALSSLVRHPAVEQFHASRLRREESRSARHLLRTLDEYHGRCLHGRVDGAWLTEDAREARALDELVRSVGALLTGLGPPPGRPAPAAPPGAWARPVSEFLQRAYAGRALSRANPRHAPTVCALQTLGDALRELESLGSLGASIDAPTALEMVLRALEGAGAPEEGDEHALEAVGWLEVAIDPAPVAVITGMNEGVVPATHGSDPMLPDTLRAALGLPCGASVAARDAYLLRAAVAPRAKAVLIAGRTSAKGDPLHPSRLLLAGDDERLARTVLAFAEPGGGPGAAPDAGGVRVVVARASACGAEDLFARCPPCARGPTGAMSVSAFGAYLRSPRLYYLERVLRLAEATPPGREASPGTLGELLHGALETLADDDLRDCTDEDRLAPALLDAFSAGWARAFGAECSTVLRLQRRAGEVRLREFALRQVQRRREGWRLLHAEWPRRLPEGQSQPFALGSLALDGEEPMPLRGRIDRIDVHEGDGRVAILDYKTGDSAKTPAEAHGRPGAWKDLQLPLYRHLAGTVPEVARATERRKLVLGYFALPRAGEKAGVREAAWGADDLRDADACAAGVARAVRRGEFDDAGDFPAEDGVLGALCALETARDAGASSAGARA